MPLNRTFPSRFTLRAVWLATTVLCVYLAALVYAGPVLLMVLPVAWLALACWYDFNPLLVFAVFAALYYWAGWSAVAPLFGP